LGLVSFRRGDGAQRMLMRSRRSVGLVLQHRCAPSGPRSTWSSTVGRSGVVAFACRGPTGPTSAGSTPLPAQHLQAQHLQAQHLQVWLRRRLVMPTIRDSIFASPFTPRCADRWWRAGCLGQRSHRSTTLALRPSPHCIGLPSPIALHAPGLVPPISSSYNGCGKLGRNLKSKAALES
jgi:hypothetical protein